MEFFVYNEILHVTPNDDIDIKTESVQLKIFESLGKLQNTFVPKAMNMSDRGGGENGGEIADEMEKVTDPSPPKDEPP